MLAIENLSKIYSGPNGPVSVLKDVSLHVGAGQFVAVRGPSGCGKTTLLLAAGGLLAPDAGKVILCGQDPYAISPEQRAGFRAGQIGFVFQQFHLVAYLNVLDNVLSPSLSMAADDARSRAVELIEHFGLTHRMHHVPAELSTGERQRTALARALLNRPKILLADEPTGNLDPVNAEAVLGYLAEFARDGGAVLLVTHDELAAGHAHRITHMEDGRMRNI